MTALPHQLDRTIVIGAPPDAVFRYFTDPARWAAWWGAGSTIDARPGGRVYVRHPDGTEAAGEVIDLTPPSEHRVHVRVRERHALSARRVARDDPPRAGRARHAAHLVHAFSDGAARDEHVQGWRYQLSLFANVVANEIHHDAAALVDAWFAAWSERDEAARRNSLAAIASPDVRMRDRFSSVEGADELMPHISAAQHFMPGLRLLRKGDVRHCQGTVIAEWTAVGPNEAPRGQGTNVFTLGPDGRIESVTGFWG